MSDNVIDPLNTNGTLQFNIFGEEKCVICQEEIAYTNEPLHILPECNHCFHTNCIISWFRTGHTNCPCCGDKGANNKKDKRRYRNLFDFRTSGQLKFLRQYSKRKDAPKNLIKDFKKLDELKDLIDIQKKKINPKYTENDMKVSYKEWKDFERKERKKYWDLQNKERVLTCKITAYPIIPIIIPVKKNI